MSSFAEKIISVSFKMDEAQPTAEPGRTLYLKDVTLDSLRVETNPNRIRNTLSPRNRAVAVVREGIECCCKPEGNEGKTENEQTM